LRFIAGSDLHGDFGKIREFRKAALQLQASAIILAGDIGPEIEKILKCLSKLGIPIYAILGNDDLPYDSYLLETIPYVLDIDGETIDIGPMEIIGCSGIHRFDAFTPDEKQIYSMLQKAFIKATKPVILVTHFPPFKVLDFATRHEAEHIGSKAIRKIIEKYSPTLCICGHVHKDGGKRATLRHTDVINIAALMDDEVSKSQGRRFAVIDIDEAKKCTVSFDYLLNSNMPLEKFISKYI